MEASFKSLPPALFSNVKNKEEPETTGILWLPPIKKHFITQQIDWLTSLQISNLELSKPNKWPEELKENIQNLKLPLDEMPPSENSKNLIFSLPEGFKSAIGLIVLDSDWSNRSDVFKKYMEVSESFKTGVTIQSIDQWHTPEIEPIEWIKV